MVMVPLVGAMGAMCVILYFVLGWYGGYATIELGGNINN